MAGSASQQSDAGSNGANFHHTDSSGRIESEADVPSPKALTGKAVIPEVESSDTINHLRDEECNPPDQQRARTHSDCDHKEVNEGLLPNQDEKPLTSEGPETIKGSIRPKELLKKLESELKAGGRDLLLISSSQNFLIEHLTNFTRRKSKKILKVLANHQEHKELFSDLWDFCLNTLVLNELRHFPSLKKLWSFSSTNDLDSLGQKSLDILNLELSKVGERNLSLISDIQKLVIKHLTEFIRRKSNEILKILANHQEHKELLSDLWNFCLRTSFSSEKLVGMQAYLLEEALSLQRDYLNMGETEIWEKLLKWCFTRQNVKNNPTEWSNEDITRIKSKLLKFIRLIRFDKIAHENVYKYRYILPQYLKDEVENEALFKNRTIGCNQFLKRSIMLLRNHEDSDSEYLRSSVRLLRYHGESYSE